MSVTYEDILAARERIAGTVEHTPCVASVPLSELCGCEVYCKLEYLQRTGSFKERGARNALTQLLRQGSKGVISASAGNHALGLAYHGRQLGLPVTVVMPRHAPLVKVATCRRLGAQVVRHGNSFADAYAKAQELAAAEKLTYVHGYDDPAVIAGQGTVGLEILEQVPDPDAVVIPVGGGGLIAGAALAIKSLRPQTQVIGVEPAASAGFTAALAAGRPVPITTTATLADGLAVGQVGANAFAVARPHVDRVVEVSEQQLALAILRLLELEKAVVEGAGASTLAALLAGRLPELAGKRVVLLLAGGNIDPAVLANVIEKGLAFDGRLLRFTATISDRPGGLAAFATAIAEIGASVQQVHHDRIFCGADMSRVEIICTVETEDADHAQRLLDHLRNSGAATDLRIEGPEVSDADGAVA